MKRRDAQGGPTVLVLGLVLVLLAGCVLLLLQNRALSGRLAAAERQAQAMRQQLNVLAAHAQDARTPELLLHRFLVAWIVGSGAEANLYLSPELQPVWREAFAANGWHPGPKGVSIDHYRVEESQVTPNGARYRLTMFPSASEASPAYTMTVTITGHPGAYAVSELSLSGLPVSP
ncbi:MAG: hypothetical protein IMW98_00345 [Firmicutes bacterium]|nr:hypothetical protein [Bacillota bacterium]